MIGAVSLCNERHYRSGRSALSLKQHITLIDTVAYGFLDQNELICVNTRACFALIRASNMAWLVCVHQGVLPLVALGADSPHTIEEHTRCTQVQMYQ